MRKHNYKFINLNNLINKDVQNVLDFIKYNGGKMFDEKDVLGLLTLSEYIYESNRHGFVVSYLIDRINKEFDLLKLDNENLINIEIKTSNKHELVEQMKQNFNILKKNYPEHNISIYGYIQKKNEIFYYNLDNDEVVNSNFIYLNKSLESIRNYEIPNINFELLNVYEHPDFFINDNYYLSNSQREAKTKILNVNSKIYAIHGYGGTGKSLLALDIYKSINSDKKSYVVPFAKEKIISDKLNDKLEINVLRYFINTISKKEWIIVDEAQRANYKQLILLKNNSEHLILFYDENQDVDNVNDIDLFLNEYCDEIQSIQLDQIIRSDPTIDRFAKKICGLKKSKLKMYTFDRSKIEILMLDEFSKVKTDYLDYMYIEPSKSKYWEYSCKKNCTNKRCETFSRIFKSNIVHFEISKDYDNIVIYLCDGYYINKNKLDQKLPMCYGNLQKQLYTIMMRATNKLLFVCDDICIYNFLQRCRDDLDK